MSKRFLDTPMGRFPRGTRQPLLKGYHPRRHDPRAPGVPVSVPSRAVWPVHLDARTASRWLRHQQTRSLQAREVTARLDSHESRPPEDNTGDPGEDRNPTSCRAGAQTTATHADNTRHPVPRSPEIYGDQKV